MHVREKYLILLLTLVVAVIGWSAVRPHDLLTWLLEVLPALIG
ncbi:MAG: putative membrane protein YjdF, partial [Verrucomicrobiales bacterium]